MHSYILQFIHIETTVQFCFLRFVGKKVQSVAQSIAQGFSVRGTVNCAVLSIRIKQDIPFFMGVVSIDPHNGRADDNEYIRSPVKSF